MTLETPSALAIWGGLAPLAGAVLPELSAPLRTPPACPPPLLPPPTTTFSLEQLADRSGLRIPSDLSEAIGNLGRGLAPTGADNGATNTPFLRSIDTLTGLLQLKRQSQDPGSPDHGPMRGVGKTVLTSLIRALPQLVEGLGDAPWFAPRPATVAWPADGASPEGGHDHPAESDDPAEAVDPGPDDPSPAWVACEGPATLPAMAWGGSSECGIAPIPGTSEEQLASEEQFIGEEQFTGEEWQPILTTMILTWVETPLVHTFLAEATEEPAAPAPIPAPTWIWAPAAPLETLSSEPSASPAHQPSEKTANLNAMAMERSPGFGIQGLPSGLWPESVAWTGSPPLKTPTTPEELASTELTPQSLIEERLASLMALCSGRGIGVANPGHWRELEPSAALTRALRLWMGWGSDSQ